MLNPLDAPAAVSDAAELLEELLDDCNHVSSIELLHVVPVAGMTPGHDWMKDLAQAVYDAGASGHQTSVAPFESPQAWRDILRRQVTDGFMQPANRWPHANLRTPAEIRLTGELADGIADLIEAHLGPVRSSGDVDGPRTGMGAIWSRSLLLVTSDWATVLFLGVDH
ncbi:hypothetical protein OG765_29980 [Streptomyces sp. NBC_00555]|uniref:hypothetical protein n=1 Tax=unclassified Streptomyces TaxID=2593676 RepID=UPI00214B2B4B|nr:MULTISPECIES: hypothetical protein [unclassified Streptomyces]MCX5015155.1 hypothetical protein [Streptomyces sp. NBC_00555]UUU44088.1 hypothetical protein JIW86_38060 [Streptomyces sp. NBC_00162]